MSTVDGLPERLDFLQGTLEVLVLRCLQGGPNHAYGISKFLERQSKQEFVVDNGSLYPALQRLLQRKLVSAEWQKTENGRRAKYYDLTDAGQEYFAHATSRWERFAQAMGRVLAPEG